MGKEGCRSNNVVISTWLDKHSLSMQMFDIISLQRPPSQQTGMATKHARNLSEPRQQSRLFSGSSNRPTSNQEVALQNETFRIQERDDLELRFVVNPKNRIKRISNLFGGKEHGTLDSHSFTRDHRDTIVYKKIPRGYKLIGLRAKCSRTD